VRGALQDLSLHILDIAENSIKADARTIEIKVTEDIKKDLLVIEIADDGKGMDRAFAEKATDPFVTTRTERRVGLGLSLFAEAARKSNGDLTIRSEPGSGTRIKATFQHSHIDRQPLGDIGQTLIALVTGNPEIDLIYRHKKNKNDYCLDTRRLKAERKDATRNLPDWIRTLEENLQGMQEQLNRS
jgi:anti-sigma regulatory factor (Ser/Thr protein kinase)